MKDEDARRVILARRARFIRAALATVATTAAGIAVEACGPEPCLEPSIPPNDAGADVVTDAGASRD